MQDYQYLSLQQGKGIQGNQQVLIRFPQTFSQCQIMIKNLTKAEYYKEKRIPIVTICRRLEPEQPVRVHLIENLPRLGTEFEKIRSQTSCQNKINLELANALKIIHELEYELQVMTTTCHSNEEELFLCQNQKKEMGRKIGKLEDRIMQLESSIQKSEFNLKVKIQSEKEQYYAVIGQYERKIEELNDAYQRLKTDREKELKNAEKFHENSLTKANVQLQEAESSAQNDIKKFQKELEKATQENISLRQKITDLQTCNQEHLRDLKKINSDLSQTNLQIKSNFEHKVITLQAELEFQTNKNRELAESLGLWQKRLAKEAQLWIEEKNTLTRQQIETEALWKRNYDEILKQKEKIAQEIGKRGLEIGERDRELASLREKVRKLERQMGELEKERGNMATGFDLGKKELTERLQTDYELKLNQNLIYYQQQLAQKVNEALESERRSLEQKFRVETQRYLEKITSLQNQLLGKAHELSNAQELSRKIQSLLQQHKIEMEFLLKAKNEQGQSFKTQMNSISIEYENRIRHNQSLHGNEMEKIKGELNFDIETLRNQYEMRIKDIAQALDAKQIMQREMQGKFRRLEDEFGNERMSFIGRVQSFEVTIGKMRNQNEELIKINRDLEMRIQNLDKQCGNLQNILNQEVETKKRLIQELQLETQNSSKVKSDLSHNENVYIEKTKKFELQIFELKRKDSASTVEIQTLRKRIKDLEHGIENLTAQLRQEEQSKMNLQKKLLQIDTSSQERWKIVESDFANMTKKLNEEAQKAQRELRAIITKKDEFIFNINAKIDQLEATLIRERSESQAANSGWANRYKELEQANKKLIKSSFTMQDLEKDNLNKESTIGGLKREIERLTSQINSKEKANRELSAKISQAEGECEGLRSQLHQKSGEIKTLHLKITEVSTEILTIRQKSARDLTDAGQKQTAKAEQLKKRSEEIKNLQRSLEEETKKNWQMMEDRKKLELRLQELMREHDDELNKKKAQKVETIRKISELESFSQQIESSYKERLSKLESELAGKGTIIGDKDLELKKLSKRIAVLETDLLSISEELKNTKSKYESEKGSTTEFRTEIEKLRKEKVQLDRKVKSLQDQIESLEKQREKTEKDIIKIYDENDKRIELAIQDTKFFYQSQLSRKTLELAQAQKNSKTQLDQEHQDHKRKQSKLNEEKQQLYKEVIEKTCKITEITIAYQELGQVYEQVLKELQVYKKKWNKMFCQFSDNNQELTDINFRVSDFRTEERKVKKVVKQEVRTERTERIMGTTQNQTPISLNATKIQQPLKNVSAFSHSDSIPLRNSTASNRLITTVLSDSGVVTSLPRQPPSSGSSGSVRLDCSSVSSKFSNKE